MKLIEAISYNFKGRPYQVPDCAREEIIDLCKHLGLKVGAEVGVWHGDFTKKFCEAGLKMFAIDPWQGYYGAGRTQQKQEKQDSDFEIAQKTLAPYDCEIIRRTSMEALKGFADESLDFVYLDGDHSFRHVAEDIVEWTKKVKKGGIVSGHDYFNTSPTATNLISQVKAVVDAYASSFNIDFYTFTRDVPVEKDDRTPSWLFIK